MKVIMLRRLKDTIQDGVPLIQLPPRTVEVVECDFDQDERAFYSALEEKTTLTMNKFIKRGEVMSNYTQVMVLLLRLRQGAFPHAPVGLCAHHSANTDSVQPSHPRIQGLPGRC